MIPFEYLKTGLHGLARAHKASSMAGHLGAALLAGYFFGEDHPDLEEAVYRGVQGELDRVLGGEEAFWYNQEKAGLTIRELFTHMPEQPAQPERVSEIARALEGNIDQTRQSGHNVIFAALGLRALQDHPDLAQPSVVVGITRLIASFKNQHAGRAYFGKAAGWKNGNEVIPGPETDFPAYRNAGDLAARTARELVASTQGRRQGFGGLWHIVNHAAALAELERLGHADLARKGWAAHRHHIRLWQSLPDLTEEMGRLSPAKVDPRQAAYWAEPEKLKRDEARLTHRVKTLFGFHALAPHLADAGLRRDAESALLYLMG